MNPVEAAFAVLAGLFFLWVLVLCYSLMKLLRWALLPSTRAAPQHACQDNTEGSPGPR